VNKCIVDGGFISSLLKHYNLLSNPIVIRSLYSQCLFASSNLVIVPFSRDILCSPFCESSSTCTIIATIQILLVYSHSSHSRQSRFPRWSKSHEVIDY